MTLLLLLRSPSGTDTTPPVVTVGTGASGGKISGVTGKNDFPYSFTVDEACQAWQVRLVPSTASTVTAGTAVESGGSVSAGGTVSGSITYAEAIAAGAAEGNNVLKAFAEDLAGNWNAV